MTDAVFWLLAAALVASAVGVVLSRSLYRAAYCLAATLVATALFYLLLSSPLLAAVQILLYTGGVLTLVVYALVITESAAIPQTPRRPVPALLAALLVFLALADRTRGLGVPSGAGGLEGSGAVGVSLFTRYLVPFELLSVLLLGAVFGALVIARKDPGS